MANKVFMKLLIVLLLFVNGCVSLGEYRLEQSRSEGYKKLFKQEVMRNFVLEGYIRQLEKSKPYWEY